MRFRGRHAYVDRADNNENAYQIFRLTYTGEMEHWNFAIYKHSSNCYDSEEWFFPGPQLVDGTIQDAPKGGLEAFPVTARQHFSPWMIFRLLWFAPRFFFLALRVLNVRSFFEHKMK